jgi:hypothetical protein
MRKLTLKRETLAEIAPADLAAVVGGASVSPTCNDCTTILRERLTERECPGTLPSIDVVCH